jgi:hypothetical protein
MTGRTSLTVHGKAPQLMARDGPALCAAVYLDLPDYRTAPAADKDHQLDASTPCPHPGACEYPQDRSYVSPP